MAELYQNQRLHRLGYLMVKGEEAKAHAVEVLGINPKLSLEYLRKVYKRQYKHHADYERYLEALRKAGLPKHAPSQ